METLNKKKMKMNFGLTYTSNTGTSIRVVTKNMKILVESNETRKFEFRILQISYY